MELIRKFHLSHVATSALKEKAGKILVAPAATRWSSTCITYERFYEIREDVAKVCSRQKWAFPSDSDMYLLKEVLDATKLIKLFNVKLQSDNPSTISLLYLGLKNLIECLNVGFSSFCSLLFVFRSKELYFHTILLLA